MWLKNIADWIKMEDWEQILTLFFHLSQLSTNYRKLGWRPKLPLPQCWGQGAGPIMQ